MTKRVIKRLKKFRPDQDRLQVKIAKNGKDRIPMKTGLAMEEEQTNHTIQRIIPETILKKEGLHLPQEQINRTKKQENSQTPLFIITIGLAGFFRKTRLK
jgi:hypothetical protein